MTWALTLGPDRPQVAGAIGISGFLPRVEGFPLDPGRLRGRPVVVAHGARDEIIPADYGRAARDALAESGAEPVYLETSVPHVVDPAWLEPMRAAVAAAIPSGR